MATQDIAKPANSPTLHVVGGWATALGSSGIIVTSLFYVLSPQAAVAPILQALPDTAQAAIAGATTMRVAGTAGVFGDLVMAIGALLLAVERAMRGRPLAAAGWSAILMSLLVFEIVDALVGFVLAPAASETSGVTAFLAFRNLFAVLFLVGTALFGAGAILALDSVRTRGRLPTWLVAVGVVDGAVALVAAVATFAGLPLSLLAGASIGIGAIIFVAVGAYEATAS